MVFIDVIALGMLAIVLGHLVIGWHLANGLRNEALLVGDRPPDLGVYVREVSADSITLEADGLRQHIDHPGTLGLSWDGGYGRLGELSSVDAGRFTRAFKLLEGEPPPVCVGSLNSCSPAQIDPWAHPNDPSDAGLEFGPVQYESPLGVMGAWLVPGAIPGRWAVHVHGWTAERRELIRLLGVFSRQGFNSLVIDYRNDVGAPRDPTGHYRFGVTEWEDLAGAVDLARERGAEDVVLVGCSTGGAIVMSYLERAAETGLVKGVVLDSPNVSLAEAIRHATTDLKPTRLMIEFGMWIADHRWHIDWEATNYVKRAEHILTVPTLVFHGSSDQTVPVSVSRSLAARAPAMVELVETPAAGHVMSWNADPDRYEGYLSRFLERVGR